MPRIIHTIVFDSQRSGGIFDIEQKLIISPIGNENRIVRQKSRRFSPNPFSNSVVIALIVISLKVITTDDSYAVRRWLVFVDNFSYASCAPSLYLSAIFLRVPSFLSSSIALLTSAVTSEPLRNATPYCSSAKDLSTITRSA